MSFGHLNDKVLEYDNRKKLIDNLTSKVVLCVAAVGNIGLNAGKLELRILSGRSRKCHCCGWPDTLWLPTIYR